MPYTSGETPELGDTCVQYFRLQSARIRSCGVLRPSLQVGDASGNKEDFRAVA
jgi:hypothetical protein